MATELRSAVCAHCSQEFTFSVSSRKIRIMLRKYCGLKCSIQARKKQDWAHSKMMDAQEAHKFSCSQGRSDA